MNCPVQDRENAEVLLEYCARKLPSSSIAEFDRHLESCPECSKFASAQQHVWSALDMWEAEPVTDSFDAKLYNRIQAFEEKSWWKRLIGDGVAWKPALSLGAACAALVVVTFIHPVKPPGGTPSYREKTKVETVEVEQLERTLEDLEMLKQLSVSNAQNL